MHLAKRCASIAFGALALLSSDVQAHTFDANRTALVAIEPTHIDVLVLYELGNSPESAAVDAIVDANRNGVVDGPFEELSLAQTLLPRALEGLALYIDDEPPTLHLVRAEFEPGDRGGGPSVWEGAVLLRAVLPAESGFGRETCAPIRIALEGSDDPVHVHAEVAPQWRVDESNAEAPEGGAKNWAAHLDPSHDARWCIARRDPPGTPRTWPEALRRDPLETDEPDDDTLRVRADLLAGAQGDHCAMSSVGWDPLLVEVAQRLDPSFVTTEVCPPLRLERLQPPRGAHDGEARPRSVGQMHTSNERSTVDRYEWSTPGPVDPETGEPDGVAGPNERRATFDADGRLVEWRWFTVSLEGPGRFFTWSFAWDEEDRPVRAVYQEWWHPVAFHYPEGTEFDRERLAYRSDVAPHREERYAWSYGDPWTLERESFDDGAPLGRRRYVYGALAPETP